MPEEHGVIRHHRTQTMLNERVQLEATIDFGVYVPRNSAAAGATSYTPQYAIHLRRAFEFFRGCSDGRYTSSSLMRLHDAVDDADNGPIIATAGMPLGYDEETEVKTGGTLGMLVADPEGRTMLAVAPNFRRQGIATALIAAIELAETTLGNTLTSERYFWVGNRNIVAQRFLLASGRFPTAMSGTGALRFAARQTQEET